MSRFYATVTGDKAKNDATRQGHQVLTSHIRGYDVGIRVYMNINDKGEDEAIVYLTSGSNATASDRLIGTYTEKNIGELKWHTH